MKKIVLASGSPRRKEILTNIGADFTVIASDFDERGYIEKEVALRGELSPAMQTEMLAYGKAKSVYDTLDNSEEFVVIGVDTSVVVDGMIFGKPADEADAVRMLTAMGGRCHEVISGYAVINEKGESTVSHETTKVYMKPVSEELARNYIASEYVLDKAGAYAIQGKASLFIEKIDGDYYNVVGFPLFRIANTLSNYGIALI